MKFKKRVRYTVEYEAVIEFEVNPAEYSEEEHGDFDRFVEDITEDEVSDILVPEDNVSSYVDSSFEVSVIENIPIPALEQLAGEAE